MHIDYWFDLTSPWCYLGLRHLRSALSGFAHADEVEVALHAFLLDPELVPSKALPRRVHLIENVGLTLEEARDLDARLVELGRAEGLALDLDRALVVPTSNAHRAIAAAADRDLELGATTGSDPDGLVGCAQDVGIEAERIVAALASVEHGSRVFSDFQIGAQMGIDLVPTYLIDQRFLVQDHQTVTAMGNILNAAWTNSGKEQ